MDRPDVPFFSERQNWVDVQPLEQYEDANTIAPIFYTEEYKDATNYFRAIVKSGEKSPRVLELTENLIRQNPAHYSAWQYRYEAFIFLLESSPKPDPPALPALLAAELTLMDELAVLFLKTYQVWHHRRLLVPLSKQPARELTFIKKCLEGDAKNYHTWSYRQWILGCFGGRGTRTDDLDNGEADEDLWAKELDFVDAMLTQDVRNNSAWHHRYFVVWGCGVRDGEEDRGRVLKRELIYTKQNISLAPSNPSAWNYLRGILSATHTPLSTQSAFAQLYAYSSTSESKEPEDKDTQTPETSQTPSPRTFVVDLENPPPGPTAQLPCAEAMEFLADALEEEGGVSATEKAVKLWTDLANEMDQMRKKYWEHRIRDAHIALRN